MADEEVVEVEVTEEEVVDNDAAVENGGDAEAPADETPAANGAGEEEGDVEMEAELVETKVELIDVAVTQTGDESVVQDVVVEDRTEDQVTEIDEEDKVKLNDTSAPSLDDVMEIPVEIEDAAPPSEEIPEEKESAPAEEEGMTEIPVEVAAEETAPAEEVKEIPVEAEPEPEPEPAKEPEPEVVEVPVEVETEAPPQAEPEPEPAPEPVVEPEPEPTPVEPEPQPTPPATPKTKKAPSKTPSVEASEPSTPTTKKSFKGSKTASVDETPATPVEKEPPAEAKEEKCTYKELKVEEAAPAEEPCAPAPEETPAAAPEEPPPQEESMVQVPVEEAPAETPAPEPVVEKPAVTETKEKSPPPAPRRTSIERPSRRQVTEEGGEPHRITPAPHPTPPPPRHHYTTYASYAPAKLHTPAYIPYSATISPAFKYANEHTVGYRYVPPMSTFIYSFDNYVKTGSFSQNLYANDRARSRSRSTERRSRYPGSTAPRYGPAPLRRRDLSLPSHYSASAPASRSTSCTNLLDYVDSKNNELRRSRSRENFSLSRTPSRSAFVTSSDALNQCYAAPISRVDSFVQKINEPYESTVPSYYGSYSGRPYSPYIAASHYESYPRQDYATRRLKRWMVDNETPSTVRSIYELEQDRSYLNRELAYANRNYVNVRSVSTALDTALNVNRSLRGRVEDLERRYTGYPYYTPPFYGLTPTLYPTRRYYI